VRQPLLDFIQKHDLIRPEDKILVALSGGRDSVVLAHALHALDFDIGIAHVNYQLRGEQSEEDAKFARGFAKHLGVPYHQKSPWRKKPKTNIQETARQARYDFFEHLCLTKDYTKIATAHHLMDSVESLFMNILRGTGIYGMKGIPVQRGNIIRPMLWADSDVIDAYVAEHNLAFRHDSSNDSDAYLRNRVRHHLIPFLKDADSDMTQKVRASLERLEEDGKAMEAMASQIIEGEGNHFTLNLDKLPSKERPIWVYHALRHFGFNREQCKDLLKAKQAGKRIESQEFDAVLSKRSIDVIRKDVTPPPALRINGPGEYKHDGIIVTIRPEEEAHITGDNAHVHLDASEVLFPLTLRTLRADDVFQPLGSTYDVRLKDYLREKGLSPAQLDNCWLVSTAEDRVVWVTEVQISQWSKITPKTTSILSLSFRRNGN